MNYVILIYFMYIIYNAYEDLHWVLYWTNFLPPPFTFTCKLYDKQAYGISAFQGISPKINSIWI